MLRVGLTGELGSGKSTVARMLGQRGAITLSSDEMGRAMMQPGEPVYAQIVERFGPGILKADGTLNRHALAKIAFDANNPRIEELNAIIHPAVIDAQVHRITELARFDPHAIIVIESALIFSTQHAPAGMMWRERFDVVVLVTAPEPLKINRFIDRVSQGRKLTPEESAKLEADARQRLALQRVNGQHSKDSLVICNDGTLAELTKRGDALWSELQRLEARTRTPG
jgi:dephospho-CoA kinase